MIGGRAGGGAGSHARISGRTGVASQTFAVRSVFTLTMREPSAPNDAQVLTSSCPTRKPSSGQTTPVRLPRMTTQWGVRPGFIVLTQACDLANDKTEPVVVSLVHEGKPRS